MSAIFVQQVGGASTVTGQTSFTSTPAVFSQGTLLVAIVSSSYSGAGASTALDVPTGWTAPLATKNNGAPNGGSRVYYMPNNPGGSQSWTWNITIGGGGTALGWAYTIFEIGGAALLDLLTVNNATGAAASTSLDSTAAAGTAQVGDLLLELVAVQRASAGVLSTDAVNSVPTTGWTVGSQFDSTNSTVNAHASGQYQVLAAAQASPRGVLTSTISESSESWLVTFLISSAPLASPSELRARPVNLLLLRRELPFLSGQRLAYPSPPPVVPRSALRILTKLSGAASARRLRRNRDRAVQPIGRAISLTFVWHVRVFTQQANRARRDLRRKVVSQLRKPVGRALALTFVWAIRKITRPANQSAQRRRKILSRLRGPVGRALARGVPYRLRAYLQAGPSQRRKRSIRSSLRRPVGRAVARAYAYAVRTVTVQAGRSQQRRRAIRSRLRHPVITIQVFGKAIAIRVALAGRAVRDRRRALRTRLRLPVGRAVALLRPYRIKVALAGRAVRDRRRALRSLRLHLFGFNLTRVVQRVKVYLAGRSVRDRRRIATSRLRRPVGRAIARAFAYPVRVLLNRRSVRDRRRSLNSRLRRPVGRAFALLRPYAVRTVGRVARWSYNRRRTWRSRLRGVRNAAAPIISVGKGIASSVAAFFGLSTSSAVNRGVTSSVGVAGTSASAQAAVGVTSSAPVAGGATGTLP